MKDSFGRDVDYLRLSVTDRCNLRCVYCMTEEGIDWKPHADMLSFEELEYLIGLFAELGIKKIKITGGEPLVKKGIIRFISNIKRMAGIETVTLTTNGVLLGEYLDPLIEAGISSINISLDSLNRPTLEKITGRDVFNEVWNNILLAIEKKAAVKINMVPLFGINDGEIEAFCELVRDFKITVRFIELMPLGMASRYTTVPNTEALEKARRVFPDIKPDTGKYGNGPAVYFTAHNMKGKLGFISAISTPFCETCGRLRLDSQGCLKPCLSSGLSADLKTLLRCEVGGGGGGITDRDTIIKNTIRETINKKPKTHIFADTANTALRGQDMFRIGG